MIGMPSALITYATQLGLTGSVGVLLYTFRASIARYFQRMISAGGDDAEFGSCRDLALIALASGGLVALTLIVMGMPLWVALGSGFLAVLIVPRLVRSRRQRRYVRDFDSALAESLQTVASSLRAGLTMRDSLYVAVENCPPAFANEVSLALKEYHFGVPIEEALDKIRRRVPTPNCNIAFGSMIISSRLGGRLPDMLKQIVKTIRERERVEGKLRALTAQGRAQAFLLCSAPPALGIGMYLYDQSKMALLTDYWVGQILLSLAIVLELIGIFVTSRVLRLEV